MKFQDFTLMIRVLHCIDSYDFGDVFNDEQDWIKFRDDPCKYLINNSGEKVDAIWAIARARFDPQQKAREVRS